MTADMRGTREYRSAAWQPPVSGDEPETDVETPPTDRKRRQWYRDRRAIAGTVALVVVTALAIGSYVTYSGDVARGVAVLGVEVGGKTRAEAAQLLRDRLAVRAAAAVPVRVGEVSTEVLPETVGLRVDIDATVAAAADVRSGPLAALFGRRDVSPVVVVDADKLAEALRPHVGEQGTAAVPPAIRYERLTPVAVYPTAGKGMDPQRAADAVRGGWLREPVIEVPLSELAPRMTRDEVDALVRDLAGPAVAAPVGVTAVGGDFQISPEAIAASLVLDAGDDGRITPRVDPARLRQQLDQPIKKVEKAPKDASIVLRNGAPAVVPHVDGQTVDVNKLATDLLAVLARPAPRQITAALPVTPPKLTTDAANKLGVKEKVSSFTTNFVAGQPRTVNIKRMADTLRGTLVQPGATFSINSIVGERTKAKGYVDAPGIVGGGTLKNSPGGGVSQVATTTFNAMYYAGFQDVEHQPHSYYFSRYPSVIEATLFWPDLDLRFRNDSQYAVLLDYSYTNTSVTVSMWSTKRYDIETVYGPRTNQTQPQTVHLQEADCVATDGLPGFRQEAWRVFKQDGKEVKRERFVWKYDAEPKFICDKAPG